MNNVKTLRDRRNMYDWGLFSCGQSEVFSSHSISVLLHSTAIVGSEPIRSVWSGGVQ